MRLRLASFQVAFALFAVISAAPARAAFHLWSINEIYTNASGTLQFIELVDSFGGQNFVGGQSISASDVPNTATNTYTISGAVVLPGNTFGQHVLFGTAGLQAAGGPAPDFTLPDGFLFSAGGNISFFGLNSGAYAALPTDGTLSRDWNSNTNATNSPTNYSGQTGQVVVPEPMTFALLACGSLFLRRRRVASQRPTTV
jgi:hypothetical protein